MLQRQELIYFPYKTDAEQQQKKPKHILINAVGFGGNAVSIIVQKTD
jgi:3-oxoacyl-(acyl-carrier-protein) synthase